MHRHNKNVAVLITNKLKSVNQRHPNEITKLISWLNGVATPETNPDVKKEILTIRAVIQKYASEM